MKNRRRFGWATVAVLIVLATLSVPAAPPAEAADGPQVTVNVAVAREVTKTGPDGQQVTYHEPVDTAFPGDVLVYTLRAENVGNGAALNTRLEDPIPQGTVLIPDSVRLDGATVLASLDDGSNWQPFPVRVERAREDGTREKVPAPPEAYTNLRWVLAGNLDPGERREVSFKVRIQ
jgi:uncharacterized repeat protein (TIGR01451 family)